MPDFRPHNALNNEAVQKRTQTILAQIRLQFAQNILKHFVLDDPINRKRISTQQQCAMELAIAILILTKENLPLDRHWLFMELAGTKAPFLAESFVYLREQGLLERNKRAISRLFMDFSHREAENFCKALEHLFKVSKNLTQTNLNTLLTNPNNALQIAYNTAPSGLISGAILCGRMFFRFPHNNRFQAEHQALQSTFEAPVASAFAKL